MMKLERESAPVDLSRYWYIAAASSELDAKPIHRKVMGTDVVLFRRSDGSIASLLDRCAHRNVALSQGKVVGDTLVCRYHGWSYDGSGACVGIPSLDPGAGRPFICLTTFPVLEQDGYVWVCPGGEPEHPPFRFPHLGEAGWISFRMQTRFDAGAEACLENFLDCPHTAHVHSGWFRSAKASSLTARVERYSDRAIVRFQDEPVSPSVVSRLLFPRNEAMRHTDQFLIPSISRVDYRFGERRHFIITSVCTPVSGEETVVYTVVTYRFGRLGSLARLFFEPLCRRIMRQDIDILRAQTENLRRFGGPSYTFVKTDVLGPHIQWLRKNAVKAGPKPAADPQTAYEVRICF